MKKPNRETKVYEIWMGKKLRPIRIIGSEHGIDKDLKSLVINLYGFQVATIPLDQVDTWTLKSVEETIQAELKESAD